MLRPCACNLVLRCSLGYYLSVEVLRGEDKISLNDFGLHSTWFSLID